jgi:hypothetical protein
MLVVLAAAAVGCNQEQKKEPVPLDQIPEPAMKAAKERLPNVTFERALKKPNGEFEILGKDKDGKVREVEVTPAGKVVEDD